MSDDNVCRTETKTYGPPCFINEHDKPQCDYKVTECGISLEGIPENEETKRFFDAARMTDLSTILSYEDAIEVANREVSYPICDFRPACDAYDRMYQRSLEREANRLMFDAEELIRKMKSRK